MLLQVLNLVLHKGAFGADTPQHEAFVEFETLTKKEGQSNNNNTTLVISSQADSVGYVKTYNA